jgi:hypothetical protein
MSFNPNKLHIKCKESCKAGNDFIPRKYTLTHSDSTGDLFLTINCDYDEEEISKFYTRFMRDEVLAEWKKHDKEYQMHVYVHVSGGFIFGWAKLREGILKYHMPLVLEALVYGDKELYDLNPILFDAKILVHFNSNRKKYNKMVEYGFIKNYMKKE